LARWLDASLLGAAVYCGTKFAVRAISDSLRRGAIEYGVRVADIEPGAVATELVQSNTRQRKKPLSGQAVYAPDANILQAEDMPAQFFTW